MVFFGNWIEEKSERWLDYSIHAIGTWLLLCTTHLTSWLTSSLTNLSKPESSQRNCQRNARTWRSIKFQQTYVNICLLWQIVVFPSRAKAESRPLHPRRFRPLSTLSGWKEGPGKISITHFNPLARVLFLQAFPLLFLRFSSAVYRFSLHFPKCAPLGCN